MLCSIYILLYIFSFLEKLILLIWSRFDWHKFFILHLLFQAIWICIKQPITATVASCCCFALQRSWFTGKKSVQSSVMSLLFFLPYKIQSKISVWRKTLQDICTRAVHISCCAVICILNFLISKAKKDVRTVLEQNRDYKAVRLNFLQNIKLLMFDIHFMFDIHSLL